MALFMFPLLAPSHTRLIMASNIILYFYYFRFMFQGYLFTSLSLFLQHRAGMTKMFRVTLFRSRNDWFLKIALLALKQNTQSRGFSLVVDILLTVVWLLPCSDSPDHTAFVVERVYPHPRVFKICVTPTAWQWTPPSPDKWTLTLCS